MKTTRLFVRRRRRPTGKDAVQYILQGCHNAGQIASRRKDSRKATRNAVDRPLSASRSLRSPKYSAHTGTLLRAVCELLSSTRPPAAARRYRIVCCLILSNGTRQLPDVQGPRRAVKEELRVRRTNACGCASEATRGRWWVGRRSRGEVYELVTKLRDALFALCHASTVYRPRLRGHSEKAEECKQAGELEGSARDGPGWPLALANSQLE